MYRLSRALSHAWLLAAVLASTLALEARAGELDGTSWRLVKIMSMDDSVDVPDDSSKYTLDLQPDGKAAIQADCNRGIGSWTSDSASQLQFGPIATTRAMCPPGSISDKYLAQFEWVRSYVMKEGHLFLATMADGAIIEFEPAGDSPPAASVLGEELRTDSADEAENIILTRLFDQFAAERGIEAEPSEIDDFVETMQRGMAAEGLTADGDLSPEELAEVEAMRRNMARTVIRQWKINKALYDEYGGRIIYQQFGPEPFDAYRQFLEQRQSEGAFAIYDEALSAQFWRYFTDESAHDFMAPGGADEARAFTTPPWVQAQ